MSFKIHFLFSFYLLFYIADAFNITQILNRYPDYSTFNDYLTQTQVAGDINSRRTITVLAVSNSNLSPLSGRSGDVLKSIMSVHVVLDYYDLIKLQNIPNKTIILTTLFQTSGKARNQQGFLNVTDSGSEVRIGSAVRGSQLGASLVGSVVSQPYNLSVLQLSNVIVPPGLNNATNSPPAPSPKPAKSPTPAPSPSPGSPPQSSPPSPAPAPSPSPDADAPTANAPTADAPTNDAPAADNSPSSAISLRFSLEAVLITVSFAMCLAMG